VAVIIYGTREYGLVDEHRGELASTTFFHLWFVPIFPVSSTWITHDAPAQRQGHKIKLYGKSVAAAYLRVWAPIAALANLGALVHGSIVHIPIAIAAVALCAWSWTWRSLRGDRALRRSDFNYVAFGTRCEPKRLDAETRASLKSELDRQWNARAPKDSPNDIARHGTTDPAEAVLAYGLLRLAAIERRGKGDEDADADRILDGDHVPTKPADGPYRGAVEPSSATTAATGTLDDLVAARAAAAEHNARAVAVSSTPDLVVAMRKKRRRYQAGLAVAVLFGLGGAGMFAAAIQPRIDVTLAQLRSIHPPTGRAVTVHCDSVTEALWQETSSDGKPENQVVMCEMGAYHLPVVLDDDDPIPPSIIRGELRSIPEHALWVQDGLHQEPDLEAATLEVYIEAKSDMRGVMIALGIAFLLGVPVLFFLYRRWARKNRDLLITK
jgi:hypothetical protein